jgi:DNA-directed RNA polymerase omega subunit
MIGESDHFMSITDQSTHNGFSHISNEEEWPGIDSKFRLIVVAALRSKQLLGGSLPRIEVDLRRHKNTSLALEEVKRGLVPFTITAEEHKEKGHGKLRRL